MIKLVLLFIFSFAGMELVAWFMHKYIMHGIGWKLHKSHHLGSGKVLEHNDWYSLIFAVPSWLCIMLGLKYGSTETVVCGAAIAAYGLAYFIVHDVFIHQRIPLFRNTTNPYLLAVRRAHRQHHRHTDKDRSESFGFLLVSPKHFRKDKNSLIP